MVAIRNNRKALTRVAAELFRVAKWDREKTRPALISPQAREHLALILTTAEAALRRLIMVFIQVNGVTLEKREPRGDLPDFSSFERGETRVVPKFNLIDPRLPIMGYTGSGERFQKWCDDRRAPHIWTIGICEPTFERPPPKDPTHLLNRLEAFDHALRTLPRQAVRMLKEIERRKSAPSGLKSVRPIRIGQPPGYRERRTHEADDVLRECMVLVQKRVEVTNPP